MIKKYKDFVNKGARNKVLYIDDDWLLKTPLPPNELKLFLDEKKPNIQQVLNDFKYHINYMKENPTFFPKVKKLDKYRAAVEKLDTDLAKKELDYLVNYINSYIMGGNEITTILDFLYKATKTSRIILSSMEDSDDPIVEKWYKFILRLKYELPAPPNHTLDIHDDNIGIDKEGNIKLLDF